MLATVQVRKKERIKFILGMGKEHKRATREKRLMGGGLMLEGLPIISRSNLSNQGLAGDAKFTYLHCSES